MVGKMKNESMDGLMGNGAVGSGGALNSRPQLSISSKGAEKQTVEGCGQPVREMKAQGRFS